MTRSILIAEDTRTEALVIRALLEREGYEVSVVSNGREGAEQARREPPDLIISDLVMPEMDGFEFCELMKSDPATRSIPFILLTGRSDPADILDGLLAGADNFISKPFEPSHLLERVRRILYVMDLRGHGSPDEPIGLSWNGREVSITADQRQIVELLFAKAEEVVEMNDALQESRLALQRHAEDLERTVADRTRALEHALAGYRELVDGVDELIFSCDRSGVITAVNAAADEMLGRGEGRVLGVSLQTIVARESFPTLQAIIDAAGRGERPSDRIDLLDADGSLVPVDLRLIALRDDERPVGWQGIAKRVGDEPRVAHRAPVSAEVRSGTT